VPVRPPREQRARANDRFSLAPGQGAAADLIAVLAFGVLAFLLLKTARKKIGYMKAR
jgi:hypothetical protein